MLPRSKVPPSFAASATHSGSPNVMRLVTEDGRVVSVIWPDGMRRGDIKRFESCVRRVVKRMRAQCPDLRLP